MMKIQRNTLWQECFIVVFQLAQSCVILDFHVLHSKQMAIRTCKGGAPMGGGTLGSKGIRPKGSWDGGGGPLIMAKGGTGVLSNGCLREAGLVGGGAAVGNRSVGC